ncbi:L,D-transpeptidase [Kitasatospora terrestris]|uniref:L,D-TPase catalytic domain-containing protein n=1 Tax=Kitasatospora terrestris TaxID=258051 RepID=A0ABP9DCY2_9ACTN
MSEPEGRQRSEQDDRIASALRGLYAQTPAVSPLPYATVRRRAVGRRRRRRAVAVLAVAAAVCGVGVLGPGAFLPGRHGVAAPAVTGPAPAPSPTTGGGPSASPREVAGYVDLAAHTVRVQSGTTTLRTLPATAGRRESPTPTGSLRVADKYASLRTTSSSGPTLQPSQGSEFDLTLPWCVRLVGEDGHSTYVCGLSFGPTTFGHENVTRGVVGLSVEDARWFFDTVQVGDPVQVANPEPPGPGSTPG